MVYNNENYLSSVNLPILCVFENFHFILTVIIVIKKYLDEVIGRTKLYTISARVLYRNNTRKK